MKKIIRGMLAIALAIGLFGFAPGLATEAQAAATTTSSSSNAPTIESVEYKGAGKVEVEFYGRVAYKSPKVTVKDSSGKTYSARIIDKDSDDMDIKVSGLAAGRTYSFKISGVKARYGTKYVTVSGKFATPKAGAVTIKRVEYDREDRELSVDFAQKVKYKNLKVVVKDARGKTYSTRVTDRDRDDIEVRVFGLKYGSKYTITIFGVSNYYSNNYKTVSKTFIARDY